ncbi:MAG: hypothetical protein EXR98_19635 [Gemmataceae bacterium]|nr:hypothetical protein [Gemmataceae bacterium]
MPAKSRPEKSSWFLGWLWKIALLLVLVVLLLGGVIWAGRWGLEQLRGKDRYEIKFAAIECNPPLGLTKPEFLDEVWYVSKLPKQLNLLEEKLPQHLREGFALHPWVEKVDDVEINPPKQIVVKLTHRKPVLAVKTDGVLRAVDGFGVLLPKNAATQNLPIYDGEAKAPQGDGKRWGDPNVEAAARKARK